MRYAMQLLNRSQTFLTLTQGPLIKESDLEMLKGLSTGELTTKKSLELSLKEKIALKSFVKRMELLPLASFSSDFTHGKHIPCRLIQIPWVAPYLTFEEFSTPPETLRQHWKTLSELLITLPSLAPLLRSCRIQMPQSWMEIAYETLQKGVEFILPQFDQSYTRIAVMFDQGGFFNANKTVSALNEAQLFASEQEARQAVHAKAHVSGRKFSLIEIDCRLKGVLNDITPPLLEPTLVALEREKLAKALENQEIANKLEELQRIKAAHPEWFEESSKPVKGPRI